MHIFHNWKLFSTARAYAGPFWEKDPSRPVTLVQFKCQKEGCYATKQDIKEGHWRFEDLG